MSHRRSVTRLLTLLVLGALPAADAATIAVTNTNDTGPGSLRWAISQANSTAAHDTIVFNIGGSGTRVIGLSNPLPTIGYPATIDATSQPGFIALPIVRLDGQNDPDVTWGLDIEASGTVVKGLQIVRVQGPGIRLWGSNCVVATHQIGNDGNSALANSGAGIEVYGDNNLIGGTTALTRNVLAGNNGDGITIAASAAGTQVLGNRIGTNATGTAAIPNGSDGVDVAGGQTTIGGTDADRRNVLSGNTGSGITLRNGANGNVILGNRIGVDTAGNASIANGYYGIDVASDYNTIGGTVGGAGNVVSGNGSAGILLRGSANHNDLLGNRVGTNAAGGATIANGGDGIDISGSVNTIGGTLAGSGNQIAGNGHDGVNLRAAATTNFVGGNRIGTNAAGTSALPNSGNGVKVEGDGNSIGGSSVGAGNTISGNAGAGVLIGGQAESTFLGGNRIGTNTGGTAALANQAGGIVMWSGGHVIGGATAAARNLISGNQANGIAIFGDGAGNQVLGNWIGLDATGLVAIPNTGYGIRVIHGHNSTIGGTAPGTGNVIAGNGRGLSLELEAHHYTVQGNVIGLNSTVGPGISSPGSGIEISTPGNLVGGADPGAGNVISGNAYYGIVLAGGGATGNRIEGNWIGTNPAGASGLGNGKSGVLVDQAFGNTIGGTVPDDGNTIAHNGYFGVYVWNGDGNSILGNSIHSNVLLGIDLDPQGPFPNDPFDGDVGANLGQNYPIVTSALLAGNLAIDGFLDSKPDTQYRVELFSNQAFDPTGIGEGEHFLGAVDVTTDAGGHAEFFATVPAAGGDVFVTATATDPGGNTSEFSPAIAVGEPQPGQLQIWRDVLLSYEGTPGIEVSIVRSHGVAGAVTVDATTLDDSATAPDDFGALDTTLTFAPGEAVKTLFVPIVTDGLAEGNEKWYLDLANPTGGAALGAQNHVLAWLFDATLAWPLYSIGDAEVVEGDGATKQLIFTVTLSATDHDVPIRFWTLDGTATAGEDYVAVDDEVVFHPGDSAKTVEISVLGDAFTESDEILYVRVAATQGTQALVWDGTGSGRILDDDGGDPSHIFSDDFESGDCLEWSTAIGEI